MATQRTAPRFIMHATPDKRAPVGAWWPESRSLGDELGRLFEMWPPEAGRIVRVLYSPPDWQDRPRSVTVGEGRRVKTGSFPEDDTKRLTLSMMDGSKRIVTIIPPDTSPELAAGLLAGTPADPDGRPRTDRP